MSVASKSELWTQLLNLCKIIDETYDFAAVNSPNFRSMEEVLQEAYVGTHVAATQARMTSLRSALNGMIRDGGSLMSAVLRELAKVGYDGTGSSDSIALDEIYTGMKAASETVRYRNFTFGSSSAGGSNNSNGDVYRCTKDKNDYDLEGGFHAAGITKIEVTSDAFSGGTAGAETAKIYGAGETKNDEVDIGDVPGGSANLTAVSYDSSVNLIANGGFETISGTAPAISVDSWTMNNAALFDEEETTIYKGAKALEIISSSAADASITQYISSASIDVTKPVFAFVRWNREVLSGDGTITLRLGTKTTTVALAAQTGWNVLALGTGAAEEGWYDNFKEDYSGDGIRVVVSLTGRSTGGLHLDDIIIAQPTAFDGKFYMFLAGSTNALRSDYWTFTDSVVNTGKTQLWIARLFGKYFPYASSGETYADV